jgi:hypothetical protein
MTWDRQGLALQGEKKLQSHLGKLREQKTANRNREQRTGKAQQGSHTQQARKYNNFNKSYTQEAAYIKDTVLGR